MLAVAIEISGMSKVYRKRGGESLIAVNGLIARSQGSLGKS